LVAKRKFWIDITPFPFTPALSLGERVKLYRALLKIVSLLNLSSEGQQLLERKAPGFCPALCK